MSYCSEGLEQGQAMCVVCPSTTLKVTHLHLCIEHAYQLRFPLLHASEAESSLVEAGAALLHCTLGPCCVAYRAKHAMLPNAVAHNCVTVGWALVELLNSKCGRCIAAY